VVKKTEGQSMPVSPDVKAKPCVDANATATLNVTSPEVDSMPDREYEICNPQPCPTQPGVAADFRTQQCLQYNDVPYQVIHRYIYMYAMQVSGDTFLLSSFTYCVEF
jgi:hypothetical protein